MPIETILGKDVSKGLTAKQKRFAMEVAKGATKADAYRKAYKADATRASVTTNPYKLARDTRIQLEIAAYETALEAAKYRTPAALRELVVQSLVEVLISPETSDSARINAARVLGTVTEVAAFTERKEIRTIKSSDDAKAQVMAQIRELMRAGATDAQVIERDADALLAEITGGTSAETGAAATHPSPTPHDTQQESPAHIHTIPPEQSQNLEGTPLSQIPDDGSLSDKGDTPHDGTYGQNGGGISQNGAA